MAVIIDIPVDFGELLLIPVTNGTPDIGIIIEGMAIVGLAETGEVKTIEEDNIESE